MTDTNLFFCKKAPKSFPRRSSRIELARNLGPEFRSRDSLRIRAPHAEASGRQSALHNGHEKPSNAFAPFDRAESFRVDDGFACARHKALIGPIRGDASTAGR